MRRAQESEGDDDDYEQMERRERRRQQKRKGSSDEEDESDDGSEPEAVEGVGKLRDGVCAFICYVGHHWHSVAVATPG